MDASKKHEPQTFQAANPTTETHPVTRVGRTVSDLLGESGNCRQIINQELNLHLLSDSLFSEQQKLRHVLDWAHSFLSSGSEVHHEFCRADSLILADEGLKKSPAYKHLLAIKYHHPVSCAAGGNEVLGGGGGSMEEVWQLEPLNYEKSESNNHLCAYKPPFSDDPCIPFSVTLGRDEATWPEYKQPPENMELRDATNQQTPSQDNNCRASGLFIPNQRQRANLSDGNTNQTFASDGATCLIKVSTSCWSNTRHKRSAAPGTASNLKPSYKTATAQSERDASGHQVELSGVKVEGEAGTKKGVVKRETETQKQMEKISNLSFGCHLKIPPTLTVYERYQLCVDQLRHLRVRQSQHVEPGRFTESPAKERKTCEDIAAPVEAPAVPTSRFKLNSSTTNAEIKRHLHEVMKKVPAAETTKERSSGIIYKNQSSPEHNRNGAILAERGKTKRCDNSPVKEAPAAFCAESRPDCRERNALTRNTHLDLDSNKCSELMKETAGGVTSIDGVINTSVERLGTAPGDDVPTAEESTALSTNSGTEYHKKADMHCYKVRGAARRHFKGSVGKKVGNC